METGKEDGEQDDQEGKVLEKVCVCVCVCEREGGSGGGRVERGRWLVQTFKSWLMMIACIVCVCVCVVCVLCVCVCVCVLCVCVCVCMCVHIRDHTYLDSEGGRCWRGKGDTIGMELLHRHHIATG